MTSFSSVMDSVSRQIKSFKQTPLEKKVSEATSNDNWGTANSTLIELARETHEFNNFSTIMKGIWDALGDKKEKWRRIYKGLVLLEYCLKYGSERACSEARSEVYKIRPLVDFKHMEEGRDKGAGIREKAKQLVELLGDHEALKQERLKATESKEKYSGISSGGATATPTGYVNSAPTSYSSDKKVTSISSENTTSKLDEYREKERKRKEELAKPAPSPVVQQPVMSSSGKVVINQSGLGGNSKKLVAHSSSSGSSSSSEDTRPVKTTDNLIDFDAPVVVPVVKPAVCSPGYPAPNVRPQSGQPAYGQSAGTGSNPYGQSNSLGNPYGNQPTTNPYGTQQTTNPYGQSPNVANPYGTQQTTNPYGSQPATNPYGQSPMMGQSTMMSQPTYQTGSSPYAQPSMNSNPYGQPAVGTNPYGQQTMGTNPYGQPAKPNPYGQPTMGTYPAPQVAHTPQTASNPFAAFNGL